MTSNDAAERLLDYAPQIADDEGFLRDAHAALAAERTAAMDDCAKHVEAVRTAERRATVEQIRAVLVAENGTDMDQAYSASDVHAVLDRVSKTTHAERDR